MVKGPLVKKSRDCSKKGAYVNTFVVDSHIGQGYSFASLTAPFHLFIKPARMTQPPDFDPKAYERKVRLVTAAVGIALLLGLGYSLSRGGGWIGRLFETTWMMPKEAKHHPRPQPAVQPAQQPAPPQALPALPAQVVMPRRPNPYTQKGLPFKNAYGRITGIVSRRLGAGPENLEKDFYARVQYDIPELNAGCYFHHPMSELENAWSYSVGMTVLVAYQPQARDVCGTSQIVTP